MTTEEPTPKKRTTRRRIQPVEQPVEQQIEQQIEKLVETSFGQVEQIVEQPVEQPQIPQEFVFKGITYVACLHCNHRVVKGVKNCRFCGHTI